MSDFVTLSCPTCGGKLQITSDIDRFACSYCGSEQIVRRSGGIVSLAPVVQGLRQVQTGVDKTASELAIRRLREDAQNLSTHYQALIKDIEGRIQYHVQTRDYIKPTGISGSIGASSWNATTWLWIVGIGLFCIGSQLIGAYRDPLAIIVVTVIVAVTIGALFFVKNSGDAQVQDVRRQRDQEVESLRRRIADLKREHQESDTKIQQEIAKHKKIIEQ